MKKNKTDALSHIDQNNNPSMVDVSNKNTTKRVATAQCIVQLTPAILKELDGNEIMTKKGPVFHTARIAGTMAAKKTSDLIPLCHPIGLERCEFDIRTEGVNVIINCSCSISSKTGVEMEALTGATVAALTVYDMCKAMSHDIILKETKLLKKTGGKKDFTRDEKA